MIGSWRNSIRAKLTAIMMLTSLTAMLLACAGFVVQDVLDIRHNLDGDLTALGEMIAGRTNAALAFGDRREAQDALAVLRTRPSVVAGAIYTDRGVPFATYPTGAQAPLPNFSGDANGIIRANDRVVLTRSITLDGDRVGTLYVVSDMRDLHARMKEDARFMTLILLLGLAVAWMLSSRLQGRISGPIVHLARVAGNVSEQKNYTLRADTNVLHASDEITNLVAGFNDMLTEIERRDHALLTHQAVLQETVALRTAELTAANEELLSAKNAAEQIAAINAQMARESALILNSATDGIVGIGPGNVPVFLNPAGARMLKRSLSEITTGSLHELVHHSYADGTHFPEADCGLGRALLNGQSFGELDATFWLPDGTSLPVEYSATPMFDEEGNNRGAVLMFRDVTERRAIERLKSEFVSTVSHELRTPLTSIRGALGLLSSGMLGPIADKAQRMLEIAVTNTDRLVRLINDILDLERMESGKVELSRAPIDVEPLILSAAEGLQSMADVAGVRIVIKPAAGTLWGDSDRIVQALTNLLGNAIKFSPRDTTVTLSGTSRGTEFVFCVADEGRGVPDQKLETIFNRFSQVDASDSRDKGGSGLGLAISQSIVTAHGGRIWAEKNEPVGSRFLFTIPLAVAAGSEVTAIAGRRTRMLLIRQDEWSAGVVDVLQRRGFEVVMATTSAELIARAADLQPDAIILDVAHGGNGRDIVEALKSFAGTREIPIVVATGHLPASYESYAAAVADWVRTPVQSDDLIQALDLACRSPLILVVEDDLDLARVMVTALESHGIRTMHAVRGHDAVQLCRQHTPSLIVLDLVLPDIDGFAVVTALRENAALARIPLVIYSALDVARADQSRLRLGPTEFLTKSRCSPAEFEQRVVTLLEMVTAKEAEHAA